MQDVIRMTYDVALCHPDEITKIWSLSHPDDLAIPSISSGWLIVDAYVIRMTYLALVSHPDELRQIHYVIRMTYSSISYHPDDLTEFGFSSGWVTAMLLCHPDEIVNFDFPQHAVALQRFRRKHTMGTASAKKVNFVLEHNISSTSKHTVTLSECLFARIW